MLATATQTLHSLVKPNRDMTAERFLDARFTDRLVRPIEHLRTELGRRSVLSHVAGSRTLTNLDCPCRGHADASNGEADGHRKKFANGRDNLTMVKHSVRA